MALQKRATVSVNFTIFENGMATATLTPVDKDGNVVPLPIGSSVPTWTASDPDIGVSLSADGLSALVTAGTTAITAATVTASCTLPDGTVISGTSDPIDVVAQPPGAPVGFKITLSAAAK